MNPPSPKRQRVIPDSFESIRASSAGEKVRFLKQVSENVSGWPDFVSSGGIELIGEWLSTAVANQETGLVHACLGALEKLPMNFDLLQKSKIGRTVNESLKSCQNQVAVDRARKLINEWKRAVGGSTAPVVPSKKIQGQDIKKPSIPSTSEVKEATILPKANPESPKPSEYPPQEDSAVSALASLLESLPELDALVADAEIPIALKKRIAWRPDAELVQMVEFGILDSCIDLRKTIDETHGGLSALHPHGSDTDEDQKRFQESRRRERAMGGERLKHVSSEFADYDDDIEAGTERFVWPFKLKLLSPVHDTKKLKSYERQDLADIHGPRPEVIYASDIDIPDCPSEPSVAVYRLQHNSTIEVPVSGIESNEVEVIEPLAEPLAVPPSAPLSAPLPITSFDDEFVKLEAKLQTAILDSEDLLKLFTENPILLRDITLEKLTQLIPKKSAPAPPSANFADDRKSWGVSTIRSSVRNQVMSTFQPPAYHSGGYMQRDRSPSFDRPGIAPPVWPHAHSIPHHHMMHSQPPPHFFTGFVPPMHSLEGHAPSPDGWFAPQSTTGSHAFHQETQIPPQYSAEPLRHHDHRYPPRYPHERNERTQYRPPPRRY